MHMRLGSITKQFTAFGFLLLCETGKASLDDRLEKYFPEFHRVTHGITMRQILGHTSGLPDACNIRFRLAGFEGEPNSAAEIIAQYRSLSRLQNEPGTKWRYNNGGYMIASEVIARVAGTGFKEFLAENVFSPIGMWDTLVRPWDTDFLPNSAMPHTMTPQGRFEKRYFGVDPAGAGSVMSTADDMLRWLEHMDRPIVGSRQTWSLMKTPQLLSNGVSTGYGFGLSSGTYRGMKTLGHLGGWIGGNSYAVKLPEVELDLVVISNRNDVSCGVVANRILDACISNLAAVPGAVPGGEVVAMFRSKPDEDVRSNAGVSARWLTGDFYSPKTGRVVQLFGGGDHQVVSIDGYDAPFRRATERELLPSAVWSPSKQSVSLLGDPEHPASIQLTDFGETDELSEIPTGRAEDPQRTVGRYQAVSLSARVEVTVRDGVAHLRTESQFGSMTYRLKCLGHGFWRMNSGLSTFLDAILRFGADYTQFELNAGTDVTLEFRRES